MGGFSDFFVCVIGKLCGNLILCPWYDWYGDLCKGKVEWLDFFEQKVKLNIEKKAFGMWKWPWVDF